MLAFGLRTSVRRLCAAAAGSAALGSAVAAARCEPAKPADAVAARPPEAPAAAAPAGLSAYVPEPVRSAYDAVYFGIYDNVIKPYAEPSREKLLPDLPPQIKGKEKPTLVVSLDGCLIESTWTRQHGWRYLKRPGVDQFLASLAPLYELVLWTETMNAGEPVVDKLDPRRLIRHRLFRDTTTFDKGYHRKDLSALNRDLDKVLIVDVAAESFSFHPRHGIAIAPYHSEADPEKKDRALPALVPWLQYLAISRPASLSAELQALRAQFPDDDIATACEKKLAELRASGKLVARGGRRLGEPVGAPRQGTLWDRLRR